MRLLLLFVMLIFLVPPVSAADKAVTGSSTEPPSITILSIVPAQGEPGKSINLYGGGFTEDTKVLLGNSEIKPELTGDKQVTFTIPDLLPGLYALYLKKPDGETSRVYSFTVVAPRPIISLLYPDQVIACAIGASRDVAISGSNFAPGARVLFDGAVIKSTRNSSSEITFSAPSVPGGLHQVQVKNGDDTASEIQAFMIDAKPEITSVTRGEEHVNSYDLIINGVNFYMGSSVMVDGRRITAGTLERELVRYIDCTRMIYERRPYDPTLKTFRIQIINPNGDESAAVQVTAP